MDKYVELRNNKPVLNVKKDAKDIVIHLVSCMCDNKYTFRLKKNDNGEFRLNTMGYAYSNYQIPHEKYEIEWAADEKDFHHVFSMINKGTSVIEKIYSR